MFNSTKFILSEQCQYAMQTWSFSDSNNLRSTMKYIDHLFQKRSRLLAIRIDLSFRAGTEGQYNAELAREYFSRFMNNRRNNSIFANEMGYIWAMEWGPERGFHYHCIFFYDGHASQQDITIGSRIGSYWINEITQGTGYFSCSNDNKSELERKGFPVGIGMIHRNDVGMRENLAWIATYLIKNETNIRAVLPESLKRFRTFGHGEIK
ncbi:Protein of unknown function [Formivibrio citricus]|uniref:YagK/YfjJ C-terminal domain-containing protein n=1 Tax=Formivibrio citricus TaxID=83765 RepID=A0A1I4Z4N7_9NEIS|nr:inovirus-type Gp2 protein [Formivibrio citricus]SFN45168.1 Protein of unknown function [Formivibrio citricus]